MPGPLRVNERVEIPERELSWRFSRSGGPGGQSVNTADSRVELSFDIARSEVLPDYLKTRALKRLGDRLNDGVVTVTASEQRSQWKNRTAAEERLAALLREAFAPPPPSRRPTKPTRSSMRERLDVKKRRGDVKRGRQRPRGED